MKAKAVMHPSPTSRGKRRPGTDHEIVEPVDRRQRIIIEAASLFASKGFEATSIRDIASASGILSGSLYHHFASKEEIFVGVHAAGMEVLVNAVKAAIEGIDDPWDRLAAAAAGHCTALLEKGEYMVMVVPKFPVSIGMHRDELVRQRDNYEQLVAGLISALGLPDNIDPHIFRLHFLGALNWTQAWYRPGSGLLPSDIGRQLVRMLRPWHRTDTD
ncbi:TetR/AcrR family transcriptional regulator [Azospirillum sp. CT11-132]|uniref:TetR/AcrR family transcriptional regulator n=1 Tax=Azospirillum sp. CT11-132 TaxID=3396317 RepID=UPI0039A759E3